MTICDTANSSRVISENAAQGSVVMTSMKQIAEKTDPLSEGCDSRADVLIGNDFYQSFFVGDTKRE